MKRNYNWRLTKLLVSMLLAQAICAAETARRNVAGPLEGAVVQPTNGTVRALGNARLSLVQEAKGYNSWSMVRTLGDKIVCTYGRGLGHSVEGSRGAYARTSLDGGVTWSSEVCITNDPVVCEGVEGVGNGDDGAMLCWMNCRLRRKGHILHDLYRTENGVSYEKIASPDLSPEPIQITGIFSVPGVGLMSLWFSGNYRRDEPGNAWGTLVSRDGGRTWVQRTVESGLAKTEWPTEASAVHLGGGRILAIGRSEGVLKRQFQLTSLDGGLTWRKAGTNIRDVKESTPSLIYDPATGLVANYYYHRGAKKLKRRVVRADSVFDNPESWPPPEVLAEGNEARFYDAGNVNAVEWRGRHLATFYSGTESDCAVYVVSTPAFMEGRGFTKDAFENPAAIRFPGLFWKWDGKLTADRLEREMDDMEAHGLLTPCIHPYPKAFWP